MHSLSSRFTFPYRTLSTAQPAQSQGTAPFPIRTTLAKRVSAICCALAFLLPVPVALAQTTGQSENKPSPQVLALQDFFQAPVGAKGLQFSQALRSAHGQEVLLRGYMVQQEKATVGQFFLTPRPVQMSQHADGEADDLPPSAVLVSLGADWQDWNFAYTRGLIEVVGTLEVGRLEGADGRVTWVRLQLDPQRTRPMNTLEFLSYRHTLQHKH